MSQEKNEEVTHGENCIVGLELVKILQRNTNLSHTLCAKSIVDIIEHLENSKPQLKNTTNNLVETIRASILGNENYNPDIQCLYYNLKHLFDMKTDLETGRLNFYELSKDIETNLSRLMQIPVKAFPDVFGKSLEGNRHLVVNLVDLYNYCTSNDDLHFKIVYLLNDYMCVDAALIDILFSNTNFIEELSCSIKELVKLKVYRNLELSCRFLLFILANRNELTLKYQNFLRDDTFLEVIFESIESESLFYELESKTEKINQHNKADTLSDLLVCVVISINNFYYVPHENVLLNKFLVYNKSHSNGNFLESVLKFFNFEEEPLKSFKILKFSQDYYISNSIIKFMNDLFSISQSSQGIFYTSDFQVIIDIIIRKLSNLSFEDQIRMDYISLIDLIIKNTNYLDTSYRFQELKESFQSILKEKTETYDQDIIRALVISYPFFS